MRLLLDECIDERLRLLFPGHDCQTAPFADPAALAPADVRPSSEAAHSSAYFFTIW